MPEKLKKDKDPPELLVKVRFGQSPGGQEADPKSPGRVAGGMKQAQQRLRAKKREGMPCWGVPKTSRPLGGPTGLVI